MVILDRTKTYTATDIAVIENKMLGGILACRTAGGGGIRDHLRAFPEQDGAHRGELPAVHQGAGDREPLGHRRAHRRARPVPVLQLHPAQLPASHRVVQPAGGTAPGRAVREVPLRGAGHPPGRVQRAGGRVQDLLADRLGPQRAGQAPGRGGRAGRLPEPLHPGHPGKGGAAGRPGCDQPRHGRGGHPRQRDPQLLLRQHEAPERGHPARAARADELQGLRDSAPQDWWSSPSRSSPPRTRWPRNRSTSASPRAARRRRRKRRPPAAAAAKKAGNGGSSLPGRSRSERRTGNGRLGPRAGRPSMSRQAAHLNGVPEWIFRS